MINFLMSVLMNPNYVLGVSFAGKVVKGFNSILNFLGKVFGNLFSLISKSFQALIDLLAAPIKYLMYFLEGIFYFFQQIFIIAVMVIKIFIAIFQYIGALIMGIFRTIKMWLIPSLNGNTKFVSATGDGFKTVIDLLQPTGLLTVVPMVALAFLWFYFALKMLGLFGGSVHIQPFGPPPPSDKGGGKL